VQAGAALPFFKEMLKLANIDIEKLSLSEIVRKAVQVIPEIQELLKNVPASIQKDKDTE
jgi:hypothetical protein